jgi:large subunit ribosomal protein L21
MRGVGFEISGATMFAVFEDGSRQYRVQEGDVVKLDYRQADIGARLEFNRVLLFQKDADTQIGRPLIDGARVLGEVVEHPSTKLYIQHFRRRKNYRRLRGHRQPYTSVQILSILLPGMQPAAEQPAKESAVSPPQESAITT